MLFNVPAIVGFPKKGTSVSERDIQIAEETLGIAQYPTYFDKDFTQEIDNLTMTRKKFYTNILTY